MSLHAKKPIISFISTASKLGLTGLAVSMSLSFSAVAAELPVPTMVQGELVVTLNKTQILHLPGAASAIVVGNPEIADISVHSPDTIFIVGRGYGQTNLIALNALGQTIMVADITVKNSSSLSGVRVIKIGEGQESYNCEAQCLPSPTLGDNPVFIGNFSGQGGAINNASASPISGLNPSQTQNAFNASGPFDGPSAEPNFEPTGQSARDPGRRNSEF